MNEPRQPRKPRKIKREASDLGTEEYRKKLFVSGFGGHEQTPEGKRRTFNRVQVPIDYYYFSREYINARQYTAAQRIYGDFTASGFTKGLTANLEATGGKRDPQRDYTTAEQYAARQRVIAALDHAGGELPRKLIENVCLYGFYLHDLTMHYYGNSNQKMARFQEALDDLAQHYGLPPNGHYESI